jgi:hypothetical protein
MHLWELAVCSWLLCSCQFSTDTVHEAYANESAAVSRLRALNSVEKTFSAAHVDKGFVCELPPFKEGESGEKSVDSPPIFIMTGTYSGYKFVLGNCRTDEKGVVVHYEATAAPVERGRAGFRAFCTDDSGLLWYDPDGSAENCLNLRRALSE